MSLSPNEKYPGATEADPNYKDGKFKDNNPSTTNNGSPLKSLDRNEQLALQEAVMDAAGFEYSGVVDTPQSSQMFAAYKAALSNGANLLSNHNFIIASPDDSQPAPSATPTSYPPGFQIFSGVFANETTGILNLTYIDGRVSFSGGDFYIPRANSKELENITEFVASVADFDGKPRTRGVSFALVGDEYRVTVGVDALEDAGAVLTPLGSVKFEQGGVATGHEVGDYLSSEYTGFADVKLFGAKGDGVTDDSAAILRAQASGKILLFADGDFRIGSHLILKNKIEVRNSTFNVDWTPTSWLTIYSNGAQPILPEWFGAVSVRSYDPEPPVATQNKTAAAIQAALDTAIDISIDPIGVIANPNHGQYNSVDVVFNPGAHYYIAGNTINIRSEHHFLGVTMRGTGMYSFSSGIRGDLTNDPIIKMHKPLNVADNGAATTNRISQLGLGRCVTAIDFERADQSNYIDHCRFTTVTGACIKLFENVSSIITNNQFASAGGGYFLDATNQNNLIFAHNIVDESVFYSRGVRVIAGSSQGAINISNNVLRNTPILCSTQSVDNKVKVSITDNQLTLMDDTYSSVCIECDSTLRKASIQGNQVNFANKINVDDFVGIRAFNADVIGNTVSGAFDIGIDLAQGFCSSRVEGAVVGYAHTRAFTSEDHYIHMQPNIHDCTTGVLIERSYSKVIGGTITGCVTGVDASNGAARGGLIDAVTFEGNTTDITRFEPANRQAEYMVIRNCIYPGVLWSPRDGIEKKTVLTPLNQNSQPPVANWQDNDSIMTNTGDIWVLISGVWVKKTV